MNNRNHERYDSENPENYRLRYVSKKDILAAVARAAVYISPYPAGPDNLEKALQDLRRVLDGTTDIKFDLDHAFERKAVCYLDRNHLKNFLERWLAANPNTRAWNERKNSREGNGYSWSGKDDRDRDPDDDFIDLGALALNACYDIYGPWLGPPKVTMIKLEDAPSEIQSAIKTVTGDFDA